MTGKIVRGADILLPNNNVDNEKWAVVAVDQFTSQPDYWNETEKIVGDQPSTLRLVLPEIYLNEGEKRTPEMQAAMRTYLSEGIVEVGVHNGFVLVERETSTGARLGLVAALDLETYDFSKGSKSAIRATEETVIERVPPRVRIRRGACMELPHVLMLLDDPMQKVIEPLYERRATLPVAYDVELMQNGGHLRGWKIEGEDARATEAALESVFEACDDLKLAVGDGNHSLAAARAYWLEIREGLSEEERKDHPARFALAEIENLHSPAICFEPIHRLMTGIVPSELFEAFESYVKANGAEVREGNEVRMIDAAGERGYGFDSYPLRMLQAFLDEYVKTHEGAAIDYIHGDDTVRELGSKPGCVGIMPCGFEKAGLYPYIRQWGVLTRKTFSMGHANEKRYYFEARKIEK